MSINRELSQLASFLDVQEDNNFIGISTGGTYTVGIGTSSVIIGSTGIITATQFHGPSGSSLIDKIDLQDEGSPVGTGFTTLNFVGTGVTITEGASGIATVTITGTAIIGTSGEVEVVDNGDGTTTLALADEVGITSSLTVGTVKIESGIITATSGIVTYNGDGSGLTNINASSLSGIATDSDKLDGQEGSYYLDYANFSGIATELNVSGISTLGTVKISSGIVTATSGVVTYYGDGTNLTLTDSVALGGDTTGDYVASISGTANQIAVDVTSGEGTTPVISIPTNPTLPGTTVTIENDLQVNRNLNVDGNITIGGTSATLFTQTLSVADADLILGVRTDANGNDVSTDTTASHGGIAIASTEGTPLITLVNPGAGETLPSTYKKIMWFEQGAFAGLGTDAWLINYGVGIGSTQVPNNVVLAAGDVHITNNDIKKVRDINATGISTLGTLNVSGVSTFQDNVHLGDSDSLYFGDGNDLEIYHDGTTGSFIEHNNTGKLYIRQNVDDEDIAIQAASQGGSLTTYFLADGSTGSAILYHYGMKKLETEALGINVVGNITLTGTVDGRDVAADGALAASAVQPGDNVSTLTNDAGYITSADGGDAATVGGISSTSFLRSDVADIKTSGNLKFNDGVQLRFGDGNDFQFYHSGTASMIVNTGTGNIRIRNSVDDGDVVIQTDDGSGGTTDYFRADGSTGESILYHYGSEKLNTRSAGIDVTGNAYFGDGDRVVLGAGNDFQLYHTGTHSTINNLGGVGDINIENSTDDGSVIIRTDNGSGGKTEYLDCDGSTGEVKLYHYGTQKFATKSNGIDVTGHTETDTLNVSGIATAQDFNSASDENLKTNIRTIEDPLAKVVQIRGVNFNWKESQRPALGVIAQEVEKVLPELVTDLPDGGTKTVNYNGLIGLLIETVKEQQKQIDTLSERLSKLE